MTQHLNFIFEKFNVSFNVKYVEYFKNIPSDRYVYEFKVIEEVNTFSMDIRVNSFAKNKEIYKMSNIDGCFFLKNTLSNRIFHNFYKRLLVNRTTFNCPIEKGIYYIRNKFWKTVLPPIHPRGHYNLNVKIKTPDAIKPALDFTWTYSIVNVKEVN